MLLCLLISCNNERRVVPYDVDTDEIYKALPPNEDETPEGVTFGPENIPGFIFDYEMTTDRNDIYVFLENFTVLDVNPKINQSLLEFILGELCEYGFVNDSVSLPENETEKLLAEGLSYSEAAARILDIFKENFDAQLENLEELNTPFNAYFQVYPLYIAPEYVTYRQSAYLYTGGAHGMTVSYIKTYDLKSGNVMTAEDIIKPERMKEVREEVAAHMAYSYPIYENISTVSQYIDSLNVWLDNFDPNDVNEPITADNFPLTDVALIKEGLVCVYQMYELTPGSDGCPLVVIPYKDIRGCLN